MTQSLRVGALEVVPLRDAEGSFAEFRAAFPGAPDELEREVRGRFPGLFRGADWWLPFRAYLVRGAGAPLLVDAGVGPPPGRFLPERQGWLPDELRRAGVAPEEVELVVLTHLHVDHVGWCGSFPAARYVAPAADWPVFERADYAQEKLAPLLAAGRLELVDGAVEPAPGIELVPTNGHTPGHSSVRLASGGAAAWILGDVVVHPAQVRDPGLVYESDIDGERAAATRREVLRRLAEAAVPVAVPHFDGSGLGRIVTAGGGFDWAPLPGDG